MATDKEVNRVSLLLTKLVFVYRYTDYGNVSFPPQLIYKPPTGMDWGKLTFDSEEHMRDIEVDLLTKGCLLMREVNQVDGFSVKEPDEFSLNIIVTPTDCPSGILHGTAMGRLATCSFCNFIHEVMPMIESEGEYCVSAPEYIQGTAAGYLKAGEHLWHHLQDRARECGLDFEWD